MGGFIVVLMGDVGWMLLAALVQHYVVGRRVSPKEASRGQMAATLISWFFFSTLHRAVRSAGGPELDALAAGALFGGVTLAVVMLLQVWSLARAKRDHPS